MKVEDVHFGNGDVETTLASASDDKRNIFKVNVVTNIFTNCVFFVVKEKYSDNTYRFDTWEEAKEAFENLTRHVSDM